MNKNLYVGNLSQKVTEDDLRSNFSEAGAVASVSVIKDKFSGVSRGFGFVEMETEEGAQEAIKKFNGGDLDGKTISVNEARPKPETRGPRRDGGGGGPRRDGGGGGFRGGRGRY
jgi:cold-inducible RNA-binding protein